MNLKTLLLLVFTLGYAFGNAQTVLPLFQDTTPLSIHIYADMRKLVKDVADERDYHEATIHFRNPNADSVIFPVRLKTRGNFRRNRINCNFPPIRLNFQKDTMEGTLFEGINKVKLVTHCQQKRMRYEQIVLQEHIIYQAYEAVSPYHYKTRLARVHYHDTRLPNETIVRWGLFIEPTKVMAKRYDATSVKSPGLHPMNTDTFNSELLYLFEYMVGNTDFSIPFQHNVKLIKTTARTLPIPVPYDWDWSGWIAAPYAKPSPKLGLVSVTQRLYRGFCWPEDEMLAKVQWLRDHKEQLLAIVNNEPCLHPKTRKTMLAYLHGFFKIADNPKLVKRNILDACRTE
ncbi:MAG: hypothetical protein AB8F95_20765 [Bacteroidia bacterium]